MLILELWDISFHAVVVFGLGKNLLFKSVLEHCEGIPFSGLRSQRLGSWTFVEQLKFKVS